MSDDGKRKYDPNATIQLSQLDDVQIGEVFGRSVPPPIPQQAVAIAPSAGPPSLQPTAPRGASNALVYSGAFAALALSALALAFALSRRAPVTVGPATLAMSAASPAATTPRTPTASTAPTATSSVMMLRTFEIDTRDQ